MSCNAKVIKAHRLRATADGQWPTAGYQAVAAPAAGQEGPWTAASSAEAALADACRQAESLLASARRAAEAESEALLGAARQAAAELVAAQRRAAAAAGEALREEARMEGYSAGLAEGRATAAAELSARLEELEPRAVALTLAVARRILRRSVAIDPAAVAEMLRAGFARVGGGQLRLRAHPAVCAALAEQQSDLASALPAAELEWVPDPGLDPGDFILSGAEGLVDGRLERQLQEVAAGLGLDQDGSADSEGGPGQSHVTAGGENRAGG